MLPFNKSIPKQEIAEQAATASASTTAAYLVGLQDHQRMLRDSAKRVRDSHYAMMKAAGVEPAPPQEDDMGDIILMGDVQVTERGTGKLPWQGENVASPVAPATPASAAPAAGMGTLAKLGIAAALMSTGAGAAAGIPLAIDALKPQPQQQQQFTDTNTLFDLVIPKKP